jgi:IS30 family transposase
MAKYKLVTFDDRKAIAAMYEQGDPIARISEAVGIPLKTLYGELKRGGTGSLDRNQRPEYDPILSQRTYEENIRRRGRKRKADK